MAKLPKTGGGRKAYMWGSKDSRSGGRRNAETKSKARCDISGVKVNDRSE